MSKENLQSSNLHLFSPGIDFLLLGGGSLICLLMLRAILGVEKDALAFSSAATLYIANFVNHPHFAHSYQIFYSNFKEKLFGSTYEKSLRMRYFFVGLILPPVLLGGFALSIFLDQPRILGLAANAMFFFVGWHYVKQGYGMAMLDAALKKQFFSTTEKNLLLYNAYATWAFAYTLINFTLQHNEGIYFGVSYFVLEVEPWALYLVGAACTFTTCRIAIALFKRTKRGEKFPINGILSYATALYAWLLIRDPLVILWIPMFHSLQYLAVVWRYKFNSLEKFKNTQLRPAFRFVLFSAVGFAMGYAMFWAIPSWLDQNVEYRHDLFGTSVFFYVFWIFINIHHYFLDTVMWRKGNPDVMRHLFNAHSIIPVNKTKI